MEIFITAYSKNMPSHNVFMGELKSEYIRDIPSPASFSSKIRCCAVKSDSIPVLPETVSTIFAGVSGPPPTSRMSRHLSVRASPTRIPVLARMLAASCRW